MFNGTYNFSAVPRTVAPVAEPSFVSPVDPHGSRRKLQNVIPKRGFQYIPGKNAFDDIPTRNIILDAIRGDTGLYRNVSPHVVDELLTQLFRSITNRVPLIANIGFMPPVWSVIQKPKALSWTKAPGMTFSIVKRLMTYLVKARLRAKATPNGGTTSHSSGTTPKKCEPSKTALAIDTYVASLRRHGLLCLIPSPDDEDDWSDDTDKQRGVLTLIPNTPWDEVMTRSREQTEALAARQKTSLDKTDQAAT
jgi:hypothetical protein